MDEGPRARAAHLALVEQDAELQALDGLLPGGVGEEDVGSEDEVIRLANQSEYGLGGAVWTKDINRAFRVARGVETGRMWVNNYNNLPARAPLGGYKKSGIGRETHKMMLEHYSQKKNIFLSLSEQKLGLY